MAAGRNTKVVHHPRHRSPAYAHLVRELSGWAVLHYAGSFTTRDLLCAGTSECAYDFGLERLPDAGEYYWCEMNLLGKV